MASFSLTIFPILILFLGKSSFADAACKVHPQFWCDNPEISAACGVTEQCNALRNSNAKPVEFALYYESMCPGCKELISTQLIPAHQKIGSIMRITLVPYGNAEYSYDKTSPFKYLFECQHGVEECIGNMLETCAISMHKDDYFPFVSCVEKSSDIPRKAAVGCASEHKVNLTKVMECVNSYTGHRLEYEMAKKTDALQPPHGYVPWVTLNGVHTDEIQKMAENDLIKLICTHYTGSPKPAACSQ